MSRVNRWEYHTFSFGVVMPGKLQIHLQSRKVTEDEWNLPRSIPGHTSGRICFKNRRENITTLLI